MQNYRHLFAASLFALAGAPATRAQSPPSVSPTTREGLRDARYCEVISVTRDRLTFTVEVYNTIGLNDCPAALWSALNSMALAKQKGVTTIKLNGPRHWVLDGIEGRGVSAGGKIEDFGGVKMGLRATIQTKLWQGTVGNKFYTPNAVKRETVWHYKAGQPVFELVSATGDIYVMQSYAQIVDSKLSFADLPKLGERLKLPAGWKYQTRTLAADDALKVDGLAYVINDDMYNSYQRRAK